MATALDFEALGRPFMHPDDMPDLHALRGYGTCMEPLVSDGTLLVIDKREEPRPGDVVSVISPRRRPSGGAYLAWSRSSPLHYLRQNCRREWA